MEIIRGRKTLVSIYIRVFNIFQIYDLGNYGKLQTGGQRQRAFKIEWNKAFLETHAYFWSFKLDIFESDTLPNR